MAVARWGSVPGMEAAPAIFCREPVSVLGRTLDIEHEAGFHAAWLLELTGQLSDLSGLLLSGGTLLLAAAS